MHFEIQSQLTSEYPKYLIDNINILEEQVENKSFTSWSFANSSYAVSATWTDEFKISEQEQFLHPIFDLSSLTKPFFLNLYLLLHYKEKYFDFINEPIINLLKNNKLLFFFKKNNNLTINLLLSHRSNIMPWHWMGGQNEDEIIKYIFDHKINYNQGEVYSDLNYFILARIFENIWDKFSWIDCLNLINSKLKTNFYHASILLPNNYIPFFPYKIEINNNGHNNFGYVHDTNANILSALDKKIVSGHAGLFGSISDAIKLINYLNFVNFFKKCSQEKMKNNSRFIYGFDTPSSENSTAGLHLFSKNQNHVFGHLGFTGTSFWGHSLTQNYHVLFTNRTSHRNACNVNSNAKRILIIQDLKLNKKFIYPENILFNEKETTSIIFDQQFIAEYPNILALRKTIGLNLWDV